ncbi:FAD-dependent monooxygenase [Streptomyces sp. VRA16 Mangrove soil]|uniref:FAD-dependent monooxygenase n=1 Tax=Streptomyces sp. VRA16 Mangrove soil TaxID=2817434 RepID=UPI001A9EF9F9|nr:FAD-dependent monooxygenase [Streptomyces sp. VRA16 Mangrove soil]MBO1334258.1 FAD-dependent monooxygenase [Streptomyces sp. VRA16 Mangrove soil]
MSEPNASDSVLVVGAGPTGLATACTLYQHGVPCRIVDRRRGPASEPKALILWSGALEVLRRIGVDQELVNRGLPLAGASYWSRGRAVGQVRFGALAGTAFPHPLCVPQSVTEVVLYERLLQLGGQVEWNTEAIDIKVASADGPAADSVMEVTLAADKAYAPTDARPRWLIGADGAHSRVREAAGIAFEGGSYARDFLLGDGVYEGDLPAEEVQYHLTPRGVLVVVPLPGGGHRVFFDRAPGPSTAAPTEAELQQLMGERGPAGWRLDHTWWRSTFRVHTKVASTFRRGSVFLAGDAAHCHSPAGGQGLNTGVQDGYDLAWKLAAVTHGADPRLLNSYEAERRPAALRALRNSDRQTKLWMLRAGPRRFARDLLLTAATRSGALDRRLVPELAQIDPDLAGSPAVPGSLDAAPGSASGGRLAAERGPRAGRRLPDTPWQPLSGTDSSSAHAQLATGRHTLLVLTSGRPGTGAELARTAALSVRRSPLHGQTDVVLLAGRADDGPESVTDPSYAVAVDREQRLSRWAANGPLLVLVRPDGVVAAWSAGAGADVLVQRALSGAACRTAARPAAADRPGAGEGRRAA